MTRLYRPYIPVEVRCRVLFRQLGEMFPDKVIVPNSRRFGSLLRDLQNRLANLLTCKVEDLRLDHDPPLALRIKRKKFDGKKWITLYSPDANAPACLRYRPHGSQFEGSHDIKTRVRGDHGQFSDLALIRREKKRAKKLKKKPHVWRSSSTRWPKRPFPKRMSK